MTGSNRLLLGLGWPLVIGLLVWKARSRKIPSLRDSISLPRETRIPLLVLGAASVYAFLIPSLGRISILDTAVLFSIFGFYLWHLSKEQHSNPEFMGVAGFIASFSRQRRIASVVALFSFAALAILASAEPFAESLIATGKAFGINEFLLVQWLAPLASESPEFLVAIMLALRGNQEASFGTLLSSKINQWTLLLGSIPLAHLLGGGESALVMDFRQTQEVFLTAAQSLLGLAIVINLKVSLGEALLLFVLFFIQFFIPGPESRTIVSGVYLVFAGFIGIRSWKETRDLYRDVLIREKIGQIALPR